jgi:hypothetical protein
MSTVRHLSEQNGLNSGLAGLPQPGQGFGFMSAFLLFWNEDVQL